MVIPVYVRRGIMNVQRVSNNGISGNFYIFNNSNYRQIDKTAVTPVKPVKKLPGFTGRGDNKELAAVYKQDKMPEALGTKQIDSIKDGYAYSNKASYDMDNMYERQRMASESTVLLGMNIDTFA